MTGKRTSGTKKDASTQRKQTTQKQRNDLRNASDDIAKVRKALTEGLVGSNQEPEEGAFSKDSLTKNRLVKPPYDPLKLCRLVEGSSILPQCVDAMVKNVAGFGYELQYIGLPDREKDKEILEEKANISAFFDRVNEKQSFRTVREEMRKDIEETGNGYLEVIRFEDNSIALIYYMDTKYVRLQALQTEAQEVMVPLVRGGEKKEVPIRRRFRKYVMITSKKKNKFKWFKEFGDTRAMDSTTGEYTNTPKAEASEIIHLKVGNDTYGVPRWSGQTLNVMGMNSADYVNWDLFENQVVPPLALLVSGGTLTSESIKDIKAILLQKKGMENFNKVLILEAQSEGEITDKSAIKIEMKEMSAARKEDAMFTQYVEKGEHRVRGAFRLPPMYVGRADAYSKSTADSSRMIAEEQVFVPERVAFDEIVNVLLMPELGAVNWKYVSIGPRLITGVEMIQGFKEFSKGGIFTVNEGIRLANRVLGMDITVFDAAWANYPIPIVIELAKMGVLRDIDEISTMAGEVASLLKNSKGKTPEEVAELYGQLSQLRSKLADIASERVREVEPAELEVAEEEAEEVA